MKFFYHEVPSSMSADEAARRIRRAQATLVFAVLAISPAHTVPLTLATAPNAGAALIAGALIGAALFAVLLTVVLMRLISVERMRRAIEAARKRGKTPKILALPGILLIALLTLPFGWFVLPRLLPETATQRTDTPSASSPDLETATVPSDPADTEAPVQPESADPDACRRQCTDLAAADALKPGAGVTMDDCIQAMCR